MITILYLFNKEAIRKALENVENKKLIFFKKYKKQLISLFLIINIVLFYTIITGVTVITKDKIINYSFFSPQGKTYNFNEISKINTGVYGKKFYLPLTHSKGDFFYIIELPGGEKIDLAEVGGTKNDEDERFVIEKLDKQFVKMNIPKVSSMKNFKYCTKELDKMYTDQIRNIILNKK